MVRNEEKWMRSLALKNRDIYAQGGHLVIANDLDAVIVGCETIMRTLIGEMIYQADEGIPYIDAVWINYNQSRFEAAARIALNSVPGVIRVESFDVAIRGDELTYTATIRSSFGPAEITNV